MAIQAAVGNLSKCLALAQSPFVPVSVSREEFSKLVAAAGRLGAVPSGTIKGKSLPVFAAPGVMLETIPAAVYPAGFAVDLETYRAPVTQSNQSLAVSAVVKFVQVSGSPRPLAFQLTLFPFSASNPAVAAACLPGVETRLTRLGAPRASACSCPASAVCGGKAVCTVSPKSGDEWVVAQVPKELCRPGGGAEGGDSSTSGFAMMAGLGLVGAAVGYGYRRYYRADAPARTFQTLPESHA